jgi:hypothetical protein
MGEGASLCHSGPDSNRARETNSVISRKDRKNVKIINFIVVQYIDYTSQCSHIYFFSFLGANIFCLQNNPYLSCFKRELFLLYQNLF